MSRSNLGGVLGISVLAFIYSLGGLAQAIWIGGLPNQSREHVLFNFKFWIVASLVTFFLVVYFAAKLIGNRKRDDN